MAYEEYYDLYLLAQKNPNALYYVVSFDVVNSRQMPPKKRAILQYKIIIIMKYVYNKLLEKEKELKKQIVIKDERFCRPWDNSVNNKNFNYCDPYILGDNFQFTVLRNTITKEEIIKLVYDCKNKLKIKEDFHIADGYYETNNYGEGNTKLYRGYCLQILEQIHKPKTKNKLKKLK